MLDYVTGAVVERRHYLELMRDVTSVSADLCNLSWRFRWLTHHKNTSSFHRGLRKVDKVKGQIRRFVGSLIGTAAVFVVEERPLVSARCQ